MKKTTIIGLGIVTVLAVRASYAEICPEVTDLQANLSHPVKGEDTPILEYIEGIWPPQYQADDEV